MARSHESYDPSSSDKLTRRGILAGLVGGATMLLAGCGERDRIAVPEKSPSSSASLDPSESPSVSPSPSETIDPEVLARRQAREKYEQRRKEYEDMDPRVFASLPYKKRLAPYEIDHTYAKESGRIKSPNNDLYNPSKGVKPSKHCLEPASETDSPEAVAAKVLSPLVAALDSFPLNANYMRMVASASVYGDPELRESVLNDMLFKKKISGPEYDGRKAIVSALEARIKSRETGKPAAEMFPILEPRFGTAEPYVDPETGETLLTHGLQIFTIAQPSNTKVGIAWRVVKKGGLWQIVDNEVGDLKAALD